MSIFEDVTAAIGNTPLVRLSRIHRAGNLVAKLEYANPGGSIKERIAVTMIDQAEADSTRRRQTVFSSLVARSSSRRQETQGSGWRSSAPFAGIESSAPCRTRCPRRNRIYSGPMG